MLRSTSTMEFTHDPAAGREPGPRGWPPPKHESGLPGQSHASNAPSHLGGIRSKRTRSSAEVQGSSLNLSRASSRSLFRAVNAASSRPYYIFLIATYRRASGSDLTATTPSAAAPAARAIAVTYPSVRITYLLSSASPRRPPATSMSRIPERAARCAGGHPRPPGLLSASSRPSDLAVTLGNGGRRGCQPAHCRVPESRHVTRIASHRSAGHLLTAPEDRLGQAITCIVFAMLR